MGVIYVHQEDLAGILRLLGQRDMHQLIYGVLPTVAAARTNHHIGDKTIEVVLTQIAGKINDAVLVTAPAIEGHWRVEKVSKSRPARKEHYDLFGPAS